MGQAHKPVQRGHRNWPVLHSYAQFSDLEQPLIRHFHALKINTEIMPFHKNKRFARKFSKQNTAEWNPLNPWGAYGEITHICLSNMAWSLKCLRYWHFYTSGFHKKTETAVKNHIWNYSTSATTLQLYAVQAPTTPCIPTPERDWTNTQKVSFVGGCSQRNEDKYEDAVTGSKQTARAHSNTQFKQ